MDAIEREYKARIRTAEQRGDQETAIDLAQGLKEYQELFQIPPKAKPSRLDYDLLAADAREENGDW